MFQVFKNRLKRDRQKFLSLNLGLGELKRDRQNMWKNWLVTNFRLSLIFTIKSRKCMMAKKLNLGESFEEKAK
ncbi:hypothetical protein TH606_00840 [Thermodesulfatator autotrophicus]|uniref:Uncharacterized protein n=1 Tax=Thermodesulfatator autotrophicus TaxID=1795632 RepID=A0A177EA52_9BACT|nr:hypothetical protein TH606_00840 [Thermodesulfatator autotrophicus]